MRPSPTQLPPEIAIRVEGLGKRYRPPAARGRRALDVPADVDIDDDLDPEPELEDEQVEGADVAPSGATGWAVRSVSFEVRRGAALALIGPPGSGKTTILRLLARTTRPTEGRALVRGRVSPVVDGGPHFFVPGLTIERNILSVAQLLGAPRDMAARKLAAIVALADLDAQPDDLLLHLSSKMRRRLAVAICLGLEPDVVLVEEAALTADRAYGARVVELLEASLADGVTVVLATEDDNLAATLCESYVRLGQGQVTAAGTLERASTARERGDEEPTAPRHGGEGRGETGSAPRTFVGSPAAARSARLGRTPSSTHASIVGAAVELAGPLADRDQVSVCIELSVATAGTSLQLGLGLVAGKRDLVRVNQETPFICVEAGRYLARVAVPRTALHTGRYVGRVGAYVAHGGVESTVVLEDAFTLELDRGASCPPGVTKLAGLEWHIVRSD